MPVSNSGPVSRRLVVVEDNDIVREGVVGALDAEPGVGVVGHTRTVAEGRELITRLKPDIVVLDLNLPDGSGRELIEYFATVMPDLRCIVHTGTLGQMEAASLIEAGAVAVVLKSLRGTDLLDTVRQVGQDPSISGDRDRPVDGGPGPGR